MYANVGLQTLGTSTPLQSGTTGAPRPGFSCAESVGFEPTKAQDALTVFKTVTFGRSVNSPLPPLSQVGFHFPFSLP